jgi:RNA polymerase sigma-70 factor (ECF subfamily)
LNQQSGGGLSASYQDTNDEKAAEEATVDNMAVDETIADEALMLAYRNGDRLAFERLYQRHKGSLYRYFMRQVSDDALAQDLYQELWSRVIKSSDRYQVTAKWTTWVYTMAHNLVIDHVRAIRPVDNWSDLNDADKEASEVSKTPHGQPEQNEMNRQLAEQLKVCLSRLPQAQQEVFLLTEESGLTLASIAEVVSISLEAAKSRLRYARTQLKRCLSDYWDTVVSGGKAND